MTKFALWWILWRLLGNPVLAIFVLVFGLFILDRLAFSVVPPFFRAWLRFGTVRRLRRAIDQNPHDRPARWQLASLLVEQRRFVQAAEIIRPNVEAGDEDFATLTVAGQALAGSGHRKHADACYEEARAVAKGFQREELDLLCGTNLAAQGDFAAARERLEAVCAARRGGVEPRVRLARVLRAAGDAAGARAMRAEAWARYREAPRFQRRRERFWAWRARPSRPALYGGIVVATIALLGLWVAPHARAAGTDVMPYRGEDIKLAKAYADYEDYDDAPALAPGEAARVARLMTAAELPASYASWDEIRSTVFELQFPGFGAMVGGQQTLPNGDIVELFSVEIPESGRERYLVFRERQGRHLLIDDFVGDAGKAITGVRVEGDTLVYTSFKDAEVSRRTPSSMRPAEIRP